jgi:hypothetical protein
MVYVDLIAVGIHCQGQYGRWCILTFIAVGIHCQGQYGRWYMLTLLLLVYIIKVNMADGVH